MQCHQVESGGLKIGNLMNIFVFRRADATDLKIGRTDRLDLTTGCDFEFGFGSTTL